MADLHELYGKFNASITLTKAKSDNLKTGRNALRKLIKDWFNEHEKNQPSFCWQGSFAMKTTVNPIDDGEYDLDDGIYLSGYEDLDMTEWVATGTAHNWIKTSTQDHTKNSPIDKNTCVRIPYVSGYHIDMPIYIINNNVAYLAHKAKGWIESDPKAFSDWFINCVTSQGEQLRSLVKYLKAWKDYKGVGLKGVEITILVCDNFVPSENRDDKALRYTLDNIIIALNSNFKCIKPVIPNEDLFERLSEKQQQNIIDMLEDLKASLDKAYSEQDEAKAADYLIGSFGYRFPKGKSTTPPSNSAFIRTDAPGVLKNDGRSA